MVEIPFPKLPVPWVVFLITEALAAGFWLSNLNSRVDTLESSGSPNAVLAINQLAVIGGKLSNMELTIPQIAVNTNRLTKLETEVDIVRRELDRLVEKGDQYEPAYLRGEFGRTDRSGRDN
jgi:hypothetical protein